MVLPNQTHSQVSWDSIFQVPLVFKIHGIPKFPEIQFEIPWNSIGKSIGNLIFKEEVNDLMHQHAGCFGDPFGITPGLVVSDITREWKWSPWRDPRSSAAYWGAEWWGNGNAPFVLIFIIFSSCWFLVVFLVFTMFYYVPLWFTMFYFYRNYILCWSHVMSNKKTIVTSYSII